MKTTTRPVARLTFYWRLMVALSSLPLALSAVWKSAAVTRETRTPPPPFRVVDANKQREALQFLSEYVFSDKPYQVDPQLVQLVSTVELESLGVSHENPVRLCGARRDFDVARSHPVSTAVFSDAGTGCMTPN